MRRLKNGKEDKKMQKKIFGERIKIADIVLVAVLLVLALSVFLFSELTKKDGAFVKVTVNGEFFAEYSLNTDGEYSLNGGTNILVIKDGYAYISRADCPKQFCVKEGKISRTGERITCLENRVVVEVFGAGDGILEV